MEEQKKKGKGRKLPYPELGLKITRPVRVYQDHMNKIKEKSGTLQQFLDAAIQKEFQQSDF